MSPNILTNRWYLQDKRTKGSSFGLGSAGNLTFLPLTPKILCLGYDGSVYSVPHKDGWTNIRDNSDVNAFNLHQLINCRANVYTNRENNEKYLKNAYESITEIRPNLRHKINYAILDDSDGETKTFRIVNQQEIPPHEEAIIHCQSIHVNPGKWPKQIKWRNNGYVFTNGTGIGYVRKANTENGDVSDFRKEKAHIR